MPWKILKRDVEFFRKELWKDLRSFPDFSAFSENEFPKPCFSWDEARAEAAVLEMLRTRLVGARVPRAIRVDDSVLVMERVQGMRLFDLVRSLVELEGTRRDGVAKAVVEGLLTSASRNLGELQAALRPLGPLVSMGPYPVEEKLGPLLEFFIRIFGLDPGPSWERDVSRFAEYWRTECALVPFRDATTKNMIVAAKPLSLETARRTGLGQHDLVKSALERQGSVLFEEAQIYDIDFTSVAHLTSFEDDPLSLWFHEWTTGYRRLSPSSLVVIDGDRPRPSGKRAAASLLFRYLRFGGRKLAYRLVNSQGAASRFAADDPLFYFRHCSEFCRKLSRDFAVEFESLLALVDDIGRAYESPAEADRHLIQYDWLRKWYPTLETKFWVQNPSERGID